MIGRLKEPLTLRCQYVWSLILIFDCLATTFDNDCNCRELFHLRVFREEKNMNEKCSESKEGQWMWSFMSPPLWCHFYRFIKEVPLVSYSRLWFTCCETSGEEKEWGHGGEIKNKVAQGGIWRLRFCQWTWKRGGGGWARGLYGQQSKNRRGLKEPVKRGDEYLSTIIFRWEGQTE